MAPQDRLVKVGLEALALLDEVNGQNKKSVSSRVPTITSTTKAYEHRHRQDNNYDNQQKYVYWCPQVIPVQESGINSNQAAKFYGGMSIVDHSIRKPVHGSY